MASKGGKVGSKMGSGVGPVTSLQPTDSYISRDLTKLVPELGCYESLSEAERRLDVYLARKKIDLNQSIAQWPNRSGQLMPRTALLNREFLRVFVSNVCEKQPWQKQEGVENLDLTEGSWTMRIEGRVLDGQDVGNSNRLKFSRFFQAIAVDFKKPKSESNAESEITTTANVQQVEVSGGVLALPGRPAGQNDQAGANNGFIPDNEIQDAVEWHFDPKNPVEFDGLDIKRQGTENLDCTITLQLKNVTGSELEYSSALKSVIGLSRGSLHTAIYSLYKYLLINNLLINDDSNATSINSANASSNESTNGEKTIVQIDNFLADLVPNVMNADGSLTKPASIKLVDFLPLINNHVGPVKPISLDYTVRVDKASTYGETVFDLDVTEILSQNGEDQNLQEATDLLTEFNKLSSELKPKFDDIEMTQRALKLQLNTSNSKYQMFKKISEDPVPALQEYISSSANALKVLSGDEGYNEDTVRRSQFYVDNQADLFQNLGVLLANDRM